MFAINQTDKNIHPAIAPVKTVNMLVISSPLYFTTAFCTPSKEKKST